MLLQSSVDCKQGAVRAVRFNVDGNYCITCGSDKTLKLWNPHRDILLKTYRGHGYEVLDAQGSCDNSRLVSCSKDKTVRVWDVMTGQPLNKFSGHVGSVNCVAFNEESSVAVSGSLDGSVRAWDCRSKKRDPIQVMNEPKDSVTSVKVSQTEVLVGSADSAVRRYDIRNGQLVTDTVGAVVSCVSFSRDGQCLLVGCMGGTVKLLDKSSGDLLQEFSGHTNTEFRVESCLNDTDADVLSGSEDGCVYCWDLVLGSLKYKLQHHTARVVHSVSHHPSAAFLLTAAENKMFFWHKSETEAPT